ncbi:MAG: CHAT domain-containing protein, partial [Anaerolineae bacterium]|nr:CHAT domain-containing protein [Anaerolineae bacterium]
DRYGRTGRPQDLDAAIAAFEDAVARTPADSPDRAAIQNNLGNGLRARYGRTGRPQDLDAAIAAYTAALDGINESFQAVAVGYITNAQRQWAGLYARATTALLAAGRPAEALAVAEGSKSRLLTLLMSRGDLPAPPVIPAALVDAERAAAARLSAIDAAALGDHNRAGSEPGEVIRQRSAARAALVAELRAAWQAMAELGPEAAEYVTLRRGDRPTAAGLARLVGELPAGTALLSLFDTGEAGERRRVLLFLLRAGAAGPVVLEAALDPDALYYDYLANYEEEVLDPRRRRALRALGRPLTSRWRGLGRPLLGPLLPHLDGIDHLIIAPEGVYHQLPLHALWIGPAGSTLLDHCAVSYIPALGLLERLVGAPVAPGDLSGRSAVFGYTDADPTTERGAREREIFLGEAAAVAGRLGVEPLLDDAATGAALEAATARPLRRLHLSCHGYFNGQDALASGVLLAAGAGGSVVYTARQFMTHRLPVELVTLSACQTAISGSLGGDEMAGLSMGLLSAGARSLLLGQWSVNAQTTEKLMVWFYALLDGAGGPRATKAETLRRVMLAFRDGRILLPGKGFDPADPYYWAPFVLVGDWR